MLQLKFLECNRCFHFWLPRSTLLPKNCPACHSPYWNKKRVFKTQDKPVATYTASVSKGRDKK